MKKNTSSKSGFINARNLVGVLLCTAGISLAMLSFGATPTKRTAPTKKALRPNAPTVTPAPTGGTLTSTNIGSTNALNYADSVGSALNLTFFAGNGTCAVPGSCSTYTLHIDPSVGTASGGYDPTKYLIFIELSWPQAAVDYDTWVCSTGGNCVQANVVASNASTTDPEVIFLPTNIAPGDYTINAVNTTGAPEAYNGTVYLQAIPSATTCPTCPVPRYQTYYLPDPTANPNGAGEPSIGVDWNPNVASLKQIAGSNLSHGPTLLNTGGVAFYQASLQQFRVSFDDCASPALQTWKDTTPINTSVVSLDPIGFVDHYSSLQLGIAYPPPTTPGRVFDVQLLAGNSTEAFSDDDGNTSTPGSGGSPPAGPDHETLGGGPYSTQGAGGVAPPHPTYANAIYYCSQNIAAEAECSRSDNGGITFGPGVPIYNPAQCLGSIHGHVKVAPNGTVYVPNSSCGAGGAAGVAISLDNGITWNSNGVPGSTGSLDPSVGIGQNNVNKAPGTTPASGNTVYLGWISGDGTPHIAHSQDQGATWLDDTNVGASVVNVDGTTGIRHSVFPAVVAGDDNRATYGFLGTGPAIDSGGTCDPLGTGNCANIWHAYIATTYDGGKHWSTIDTTPNKAVQKGVICTQGTTCAAGRNLLDFTDFGVDSQGRGLFAYDDGVGPTGNNTFDGQSGGSQATIARQSGGKRLFSFFDPVEPAPPANPQALSAVKQSSPTGVLVKWLEPDNGGMPITGYNIYRGTTSGTEAFLAHVTNDPLNVKTEFLDTSADPNAPNYFYHVAAVNDIGESGFCEELSVVKVNGTGDRCVLPYLQVAGAGAFVAPLTSDPTMGEATIEYVDIGEPFSSCSDNSITFLMKVKTLDPGGTGMPVVPQNAEWQIIFHVTDTLGRPETVFVDLDTQGAPPTPEFSYGREDTDATAGTVDSTLCSTDPVIGCPKLSGSFTKDGTIIIKLDVSTPIHFNAPTGVAGAAFDWDASKPGTILGVTNTLTTPILSGNTILLLGFPGVGGATQPVQTTTGVAYTRIGNAFCGVASPPVALLTATPMTGTAPLSVNFDGSTSHVGAGACPSDAIQSYTLNFGDGTAPVTQASPMFSHTYNSNGDFPARLTVKDNFGLVSTNVAEVVISVDSTLTKAVSRKFHPGFGNGDINLRLVGSPRGVECRSTQDGTYTIVYSFLRNLTGVDSAKVTEGTATIDTANTKLGPNANQYTVALTGVTNAQYLHVQLDGVHDTAGAITNLALARVGILFGDVNASGRVDGTDVSLIRQNNFQALSNPTGEPGDTIRADINVSGRIDGTDVSFARQQNFTVLPSSP